MKMNRTDQTRTVDRLVLPAPQDAGQHAVWTGDDFAVGSNRVRVLCYDVAACGWTDALTQLHEEVGRSDHFAGSKLFDAYDRALMHFRRYDMPALVSLLERAGFVVERKSHLGFFLYPGFYVAKRRNQSRHAASNRADEQRVVEQRIAATRRSGAAMGWVMKIKEALRSRFYYRVGVRCLVTCRKPA
jgi:hypothetical protein